MENNPRKNSGALLLDVPSGNRVLNNDGNEIGSLSHMVIDLNTGCLLYAVISTGSVLGMGGKLSAVPWQTLRLGPEEGQYVLDVPVDKLKLGPVFDRRNWQQTVNRDWLKSLFTYYGYQSPWETQQAVAQGAGPEVYPRQAGGSGDVGPTQAGG